MAIFFSPEAKHVKAGLLSFSKYLLGKKILNLIFNLSEYAYQTSDHLFSIWAAGGQRIFISLIQKYKIYK